ncbi:MAG: BrnT family toxin [Acidobacteriota bacterium]
MKLDWFRLKAESNLKDHGVSFEEATTVFDDPLVDMVPDLLHSFDETRFAAIGTSTQDRLLVVVFTERGDTIHIITAREVTPKERRHYESHDYDS